MTAERDRDNDATVRMPRPTPPEQVEVEDTEPFDPEKTITQEDWESTVIRRVAPRVAEVRNQVADPGEETFGWETGVLRRLSRELTRDATEP